MSQNKNELEQEFESVLAKAEDKIKQAQKLVDEALQLSQDNNLVLSRSNVDSLMDSICTLSDKFSWAESYSVWESSSYNC